MKRQSFVFLCSLFFIPYLGIAQSFTKAQIVEEMQIVRKRLDKIHPNPYMYTSKDALDSAQQNILANLPDPVSKADAYVALATLISRVQDGHTGIYHTKKTFGKNPKSVPLFLRKVENTYRLSYNATPDSTWLRTSEILSVAGVPVEDWVSMFTHFIGDDADNPYANAYYPVANFSSYLLRMIGPKDSVEVVFRSPGSAIIEKRFMKTQTTKESIKWISKRYPQALKKNFRYTVLDSTKRLASLEISSFSLSGKFLDLSQTKFKRSLKKSFHQIQQDSIQNLILDLRGNGGGFIPNITRLMRYVSLEPFTLLESVAFKRSAFRYTAMPQTVLGPLFVRMAYKRRGEYFMRQGSNRPNYPIKNDHFSGGLTVLMDPGSYSATTFTIGLLADQQRARFVGTLPGGIHWGSFAGTWQNKKLPYTRLRTHIPIFKLVHSLPNRHVKTPFVEPDYWVQPTTLDFMQRRDGVLEFAKQLHGVTTAKPQSGSSHLKSK